MMVKKIKSSSAWANLSTPVQEMVWPNVVDAARRIVASFSSRPG